MHTDLFSLSRIFTESVYRIPDYQRGYSWTARQIRDFWSDIVLLDDGRDHYTGVLTLEEVPSSVYKTWEDDVWIIDSKRFAPNYVVDGQQRLTTALILVQTVIERIAPNEMLNYTSREDIRKKFIFESRDGGHSRSYIFGYEKDNPSYEFLKTGIFNEASDNHDIGERTLYTHNLAAAKEFFGKKIAELPFPALEQLFTKITQHFLFNIYTIGEQVDVFVAFETMNNRGKPLSYLELLKNRLIFLTTRLAIDQTERTKLRSIVNESWKTVYHYLGKDRVRPLDDDAFLSVHYLLYMMPRAFPEMLEDEQLYYMAIRTSDEFNDYLLAKFFTTTNIARPETDDAATHDDSDSDDDSGFRDASVPALTANEVYAYAHDLKRIAKVYYEILSPEDGDFDAEQKQWLVRLNRLKNENAQVLALVAAQAKRSGKEFVKLLRSMEQYEFLRTLIRMYYHPDRVDFRRLALQLQEKSLKISEVTAEISHAVEQVAKSLRNQKQPLRFPVRQGYYGWRAVKYFLFEYEQELKRKSRTNRDKISWDEFASEDFAYDYVSVEHIYPQQASNAYWKERFSHLPVKKRNLLRNSLGNLLALSKPRNAALSNRAFPEKRKGTDETSGYRAGSYSEIEVARSEDWTPACILDRGVQLLRFLEKRWGLSIGDDGAAARLLGIGFMMDQKTPDRPKIPKTRK